MIDIDYYRLLSIIGFFFRGGVVSPTPNPQPGGTQLEHVLSPNIRSLELVTVFDLICFRSTKYSLKEFLDGKYNFCRQVSCF